MQSKKQEGFRQEAQVKDHKYVICQMCSRKIEPAVCGWQEDDKGTLYCRDCKAERESCGYSDYLRKQQKAEHSMCSAFLICNTSLNYFSFSSTSGILPSFKSLPSR